MLEISNIYCVQFCKKVRVKLKTSKLIKSLVLEKRKQINIIYLSWYIRSQMLSINLTACPQYSIFKIIPVTNANTLEANFFLTINYIIIFKKIGIDSLTILCQKPNIT